MKIPPFFGKETITKHKKVQIVHFPNYSLFQTLNLASSNLKLGFISDLSNDFMFCRPNLQCKESISFTQPIIWSDLEIIQKSFIYSAKGLLAAKWYKIYLITLGLHHPQLFKKTENANNVWPVSLNVIIYMCLLLFSTISWIVFQDFHASPY